MPPQKTRTVTVKQGKAREYLLENFHSYDGRQQCLNGHVLLMYVNDKQSAVSKIKPQPTVLTGPESRPSTSTACEEPSSQSEAESLKTSLQMTVVRRRGEPLTPGEMKLKQRLAFVSLSSKIQKQKLQKRNRELIKTLKTLPYKFRCVNQKVRRLQLQVQTARKKISAAKKDPEHRKMAMEIQRARARERRMEEKIKNMNIEMKAKQRENADFVTQLQSDQLTLKEEMEAALSVKQKEVSSKRDKKTYSSRIRLLVFDMVMRQVPTSEVPGFLQKVCQRFDFKLSSGVPQRSTIEQMVRELGIISDLQCAEVAMAEENITLGFNSTTQEDVHINAVLFTTTASDCRVIAVDQLPGCTADDYHQHVCDTIDCLAATYADFHRADYQECRKTIISHISNTMTDGDAVNHAAVRLISRSWGKTLNELNCHLHPLDSIASACRRALKSLEKKRGLLFGVDCIAARVVLRMNKMCFRDGEGDPEGFTTFLDAHGLPRGVLPRYRGNRLHILFHICGTFIQNYDLFHKFLTTGVVSCGGLQASILEDFTNPTAVAEFCILGLFGKLLTGPLMTKFYTSAEQQIDYMDAVSVVKELLTSLGESAKNPMQILDRRTDFFGDSIDADQYFEALEVLCSREETVRDMIVACLDAIIAVLSRQYSKHFAMDLTEDQEQQFRTETQSAKLHNMDAEAMMGLYSAAKDHAPSATLCYLSSKMRAKKNGVVPLLDAVDADKREHVMAWAVGRARKKRQASHRKVEDIREELSQQAALQKQALADLPQLFPDLEEKSLSDLSDVLFAVAIGRDICHCWYDTASSEYVLYNGKMEELVQEDRYIVAYWTQKETYEDAVDYIMSRFELSVDVVCGDLLLS
ncbi:hypothetical protein ACOMHN_002396 [Nucella lapillus]